MKRAVSLLLLFALLLCLAPAALADEPMPIPVIPKEDITPTLKGIHHYMLMLSMP